MIRGVIFDFDGTLVLSNEIKRNGFFVVAADFLGGREFIEELLANPPGDRFAICSALAERFGVDCRTLSSRYSTWCEERILRCPERAGASMLLGVLRSCHVSAFVISATPSAQLRAIIEQRYPPNTFRGVFGGYGEKMANLQSALTAADLAPGEVLVVGDGIDDYRAALALGCEFQGVAGGTLADADLPISLLSDLATLRRYIPERSRLR